jgi:hypothetical protein
MLQEAGWTNEGNRTTHRNVIRDDLAKETGAEALPRVTISSAVCRVGTS